MICNDDTELDLVESFSLRARVQESHGSGCSNPVHVTLLGNT